MTKIEWADETWNPMTGCTPISEGCTNCYAKKMANRLKGRYGYPEHFPFTPATFHPDKIDIQLFPIGKRVFVCSMGDLFHEKVNIRGDEIREIFECMAHHDNIFMILTKRPNRMKTFIKYLYGDDFAEQMPHVWLGVTAESQHWGNIRIPILLQIPAAVRFVSVEPMLGPVDLDLLFDWHCPQCNSLNPQIQWPCSSCRGDRYKAINWVICGAETGPKARPMSLEWAIDLKDQCKEAGIPFFFKKASKGDMVPDEILVREFPQTERR